MERKFGTAIAMVLTGLLSSSGCASSPPAGSETDIARFRNIEEIVVAPTSGLHPLMTGGYQRVPRFPQSAPNTDSGNVPSVAFVIDTLGFIEPGTVVFLSAIPAGYRRPICDWSRLTRFGPLVLDGVRKRALTVSSFAFFRSGSPFPPDGPPSPSRNWATEIGDMPVSEVFPMLEKKPHC